MKKLYEKPDVEYVELIAKEPINLNDEKEEFNGEPGLKSSIFG